MIFNRIWAMPNSETFSIKPIGDFVNRYLSNAKVSVDPFARNKRLCTHTNDLDPNTQAEYHLLAEDFLTVMHNQKVQADVVLFDPPYSNRQISECYKSIGLEVGMKETQNGAMYKKVRDCIMTIIKPQGIVLSFGWNSNGMGKTRGFEIIEILLVPHGAAHNDTICIAERYLGVDKI